MDKTLEELLQCQNGPCKHSSFAAIKDVIISIVTLPPPSERSILNINQAYYNDHGEEHLKRVAANYADIIASSPIILSSCELFLALLSIWLHDIGLFLGRQSGEDPIIARNEHYRKVRDAISHLENRGDIARIGLPQKELVVAICEGHSRKTDLSHIADITHLYGEDIRPQMLASILRVADALDIDRRRAPELIFQLFEESIPAGSREHWVKYSSISGTKINSQYASVDISVFLDEDNLQTLIHQHVMLNKVHNAIQNEIHSVEEVFAKHQIPIHRVRLLNGLTNAEINVPTTKSQMIIGVLEHDFLCAETLDKFREILRMNPGKYNITLKIASNDQSTLIIHLPSNFSVSDHEAVRSQICDLLSPLKTELISTIDRGGIITK